MKSHLLPCLLISLAATLVAVAFWKPSDLAINQSGLYEFDQRISIVATFYPIGEFARQVGGDLITVTVLTPAGAEPHEYEPTPQQIGQVYDADIFLTNGGEVDVWATDLIPELETRGVKTVEMSTVIDTLEMEEDGEVQMDPHFWLDPSLAMHEVELIRDTLSSVDPKNISTYTLNATRYLADLSALDTAFQTELATCDQRTVVTSHDAFGYMATRYHFTILSLLGLSPEEEPSAGELADIAKEAKAKGVKYIYFETLVSPKLSETIAREIGATTLVLNPLEGLSEKEISQGESYLSVMRQNLANLKTGMVCHD